MKAAHRLTLPLSTQAHAQKLNKNKMPQVISNCVQVAIGLFFISSSPIFLITLTTTDQEDRNAMHCMAKTCDGWLTLYITPAWRCYPDSVPGPAFNRARDMVHWLFVNCDQCRLVLLRKKPTLLKLCCAGVVLVGLILSLIPVIAGMDKEGESGKQAWLQQPIVGRILWPLCFMFGFVSLVIPFNLSICQ